MKTSVKQYAQALLELTREKTELELSEIIKNFAWVLIDHNKTVQANRIIDRFQEIWNKENSLVEAEIISVHELTDQTLSFLNKYIKESSQAKEIVVKNTIDANVLGGVVIKYGDRIVDGSLKIKLLSLKQSIQN